MHLANIVFIACHFLCLIHVHWFKVDISDCFFTKSSREYDSQSLDNYVLSLSMLEDEFLALLEAASWHLERVSLITEAVLGLDHSSGKKLYSFFSGFHS